jgi:thiol-disulfide isomerase/thioredoxin
MKYITIIITLLLTANLFALDKAMKDQLIQDLREGSKDPTKRNNPDYWFDRAREVAELTDPFHPDKSSLFNAYYTRGIGTFQRPKNRLEHYTNLVSALKKIDNSDKTKRIIATHQRKITAINNINTDVSHLSIPTLSGAFNVSEHKGKVIVLDFFATWCSPCVNFTPKIEAIKTKYGNKVEVVVVSLDTNKDAVVNYFRQKLPTLHVNFSGKVWDNELYGQYAISGIPSIALINQDNILVDVVGRKWFDEKVEDLVLNNKIQVNYWKYE